MKKKRLLYLCAGSFFALLISLTVLAQQTVRGTLRTTTGEPLIGATVTVKGTTNSTLTDANGQFSINAANGNVLVVTSVGYQPREITVTGTEINETLQSGTTSLNEVVVIGYQSVRR